MQSVSKKRFPRLAIFLSLVAAAIFFHTHDRTASAQEALPDSQKAAICFDAKLDGLKTFAWARALLETQNRGEFGVFGPSNIDRIFGAVGSPPDLESMNWRTDQPTMTQQMNFFVQITYDTVGAADQAMEKIAPGLSFSEELETAVTTYIRHRSFDNVVMHRKSEKVIEIGTLAYIDRDNRRVLSLELIDAWNETPAGPVRAAGDSTVARVFLDQIAEMVNQNAQRRGRVNEETLFLGEILPSTGSFQAAFSLDGPNLLTLTATPVPGVDLADYQQKLDSLFVPMKAAIVDESSRFLSPITSDLIRDMLSGGIRQADGRLNFEILQQTNIGPTVEREFVRMNEKQAEARELNRFRQMSLAALNYESAFQKFPFAKQEEINFGWRAMLLPFLSQNNLYDLLNTRKKEDGTFPGWDAPENLEAAATMPEIFGTGGRSDIVHVRATDRAVGSIAEIRDGTSNTICFLEYPPGQADWTKPQDISVDDAVAVFAALNPGESLIASFYDGSVRRIPAGIDEELLRNMLHPNDGNQIDFSWDQSQSDYGNQRRPRPRDRELPDRAGRGTVDAVAPGAGSDNRGSDTRGSDSRGSDSRGSGRR